MQQWEGPTILTARNLVRHYIQNHKALSKKQVEEAVNKNEELKSSVITMFNLFEEMYLAIEAKRVDEVYLKEAFQYTFTISYDVFHSWLESYVNKGQQENLKHLKRLWPEETPRSS